ncbi:hypothetical protein ABT294_08085 [Nonomuraea sp. NPDC000554]|uniref:hypothetical protein n=1 Tax=Nonomuraea sp. NPDC000554 TaxID=3154259 RepID=UPI00332E724D
MREEFRPWHAFARSRGLHALGASLAVLTVVTGLWGRYSVSFPQALTHLPTPVPVSVLMPLPFACLTVMSLHSGMGDFEAFAVRSVRRMNLGQLAAFLALSAAGMSLGLAAGGAWDTAGAALRNLAWWAGVGCLSGLVFGWRLAWVAPLVTAVPMYVFAVADDEVLPWAVPKLDASVPYSWFASFLLLATGLVLVAWRGSRVRRAR